ncbi:hypothetical protein RhiirC2_798461 [Rhizophagus irregularis]|uniref:RNase H type-1 domain-containing protein n=1 Tax=Rhizophagus irregularis TaxID=588596 RepID=A0A2N1M6E4_9GLOM|nr:hypothetical protein RhiirC2_798461 [Rhizophagus irregularis]
MITYLQGFLDCDACPSTIDLEPWSYTFSLRTHSLFNSLIIYFHEKCSEEFQHSFPSQLVTPCGSRLLSWKDLRFLKRVSNKGSVSAWFNYLFNFVVIFNSPSFFVLPQFRRIPNSHTIASISFIDISQNYLFNSQWAISFNRNTNSFLVGRVIITYPALRNKALISHWIASSADDLLSDFTACQGYASAILRSSISKTLIKRCPSEKCFSYVSLSNLIRYPTKSRTYIHADSRSVLLSASLGYAKSLLLFHLFAPARSLPTHSTPSIAYAWTAIDSDGFILESHYNTIPPLSPSALRSESSYVETSFIPQMLKESNHLLWSSVKSIISQKNLDVTLIKVPAHADDSLNNHVDALAKAAHADLQISSHFLTLAVLPRFNSSIFDIDWACTKFCLNNKQLNFSYRNGRSEFCAFHIKILLDMLLTLTTLQRRKPHLYDPSWPCPQCNSSSETLNHLWTCPYILPEFSPLNTFKTLLLDLQTNYLESPSFCDSFNIFTGFFC